MTHASPHILIFGPGFTAKPIMRQLKLAGWTVTASYRREDARNELMAAGYGVFDIGGAGDQVALESVSHILTSIAPGKGDAAYGWVSENRNALKNLRWVGYLSSTNVYGDHAGDWVDEDTPPTPSLARGKQRIDAEEKWSEMASALKSACHIFRLAGIYGPGRNALRSLLVGKARRIVKEGQVFSRIHVEDICQTVIRAAESDLPTNIFNLADDHPAPPQDVIVEAARLLGIEPPPAQDWDKADMSDMARSFYLESKRVKNSKIKSLLGIDLTYSDYKTGLESLVAFEKAAHAKR